MSTEDTVDRQRKIQEEVAQDEQKQSGKSNDGALQLGARLYPEPPFPKQHQAKPGNESDLDPQPMWDAPFYRAQASLRA